jgi:hypothetical protein
MGIYEIIRLYSLEEAPMAEQEAIVPHQTSDRRRRAEASDGAIIAKAADVRKLLARIKSRAPLRPVKIMRGWALSYGLMAACMSLNILNQSHVIWYQRGMARALNGHIFLLSVDFIALFGICITTRSSLTVSMEGIEMRSWFVRRQYRFSDMVGGFELLQRRYLPGFDIVFRLPPYEPSMIDAPTRRVRVMEFDDLTDSDFLEFLCIYKKNS